MAPSMDNYYEWLDVAPDAERDVIRDAYREKRDALRADQSESARAESARLNRAWNVLSDPTQRERYDDRLAEYRDSGEIDEEYESDNDGGSAPAPARSTSPARPRPRSNEPMTKAERRAEMRRQAAERRPTLVLPEGYVVAPNRSRLMALGFDAAVLVLIYLLFYVFLGGKLIDHNYPGERKHLSDLTSQSNDVKKKESAANKAASDADKAAAAAKLKGDTVTYNKETAAAKTARATAAAEKRRDTSITAAADKIRKKLLPTQYVVLTGSLVAMLLYLVPSTAISGQTLGKKLRGVRVIRVDGTLPGFSTAFMRFGVPLVVSFVLQPLVGPLAFALVLIGMVGWLNNPNRQGLHDRLAKTAVIVA